MNTKKNKFLTAEWRKLILANYSIDPEILAPFVPKGTELDFFRGTCYVSLVGFMFLNTKVLGLSIPFHKHFEEFNLRFYVKRKTADGWKRGVVFIKEIVPKAAIAYTARLTYREPYMSLPMKHEITYLGNNLNVSYSFQYKNFWNEISVQADFTSFSFNNGSEEEFITEHYWGYNRYAENTTVEYEVEHPTWKLYPVKYFSHTIKCEELYGEKFAITLQKKPVSVMLAEGSEINVRQISKMFF